MPTNLLDAYWNLCLVNESSLESAEKLTDAHMDGGKNGYSFGVKQFDLKTNEEAGALLADILDQFVGSAGSALKPDDVAKVRGDALKLSAGDVDASADLKALVARINATLALSGAKTLLHEKTRGVMEGEVKATLSQIEEFGDAVSGASFFKQGLFGPLFLLDYKNFFGNSIETLTKFVAGDTVTLNNGINVVKASDPFVLTDLMHYILSTKQGSGSGKTGRADVLRRISNIVREVRNDGALPLTTVDVTWLTTILDGILNGQANQFIVSQKQAKTYHDLIDLIETAKGMA